ncbi:hypothetical protein SFHH103_04027 (plasmid) [Sinorhizobium fredii HH103]|uniref:Uncharacterized protein n=1 Tax=Sinorhizobium fredii (strain HH103) TaxID=1117943 RepID=G9ABT9_SINF1|nr:hypothetical protein SFHH103_04027 [Sinorhizobium fredii HH103]
MAKVYAADELSLRITTTKAPWLLIAARGRVSSTGWHEAQLVAYMYLTPPADGVQEFDFIARKPDAGNVQLPVLSPISTELELPNVDVENYWGSSVPLRGIRVYAVSNRKEVDVLGRLEARAASAAPMPRSTATYVTPTPDVDVISFEEDIKTLFRPRDVNVMQAMAGFNLHQLEDVRARADKILDRLRTNMPCDGLWPAEDVAKFQAWIKGGMAA